MAKRAAKAVKAKALNEDGYPILKTTRVPLDEGYEYGGGDKMVNTDFEGCCLFSIIHTWPANSDELVEDEQVYKSDPKDTWNERIVGVDRREYYANVEIRSNEVQLAALTAAQVLLNQKELDRMGFEAITEPLRNPASGNYITLFMRRGADVRKKRVRK